MFAENTKILPFAKIEIVQALKPSVVEASD